MKTVLKMILSLFALGGSAATAHAQTPTPVPPQTPGLMTSTTLVRNGGDTYDRDALRAREEAIARQRNKNGSHAVPASPEDVQAGADVRDPKGVVVGQVESVSMSAAVVVTEVGKVEVPLEAFGKNSKGLMISMPKSDFDRIVADANKPK